MVVVERPPTGGEFDGGQSETPSLREFLHERWEQSDQISTTALTTEVRERFGADVTFLTEFFDEYLQDVVEKILAYFARNGRRAFIETSEGFISREKLEENARTRLAHVFEASGTGIYRSFLSLDKKQLLELNERDEKTIATRKNWVGFRRDLAGRMTAKQTVAERFSTAELEAAWRKHFSE